MDHHPHLRDLADLVAADGPDAHHRALVELAERAAQHVPAAALVLADPTAPVVARQRAVAVASAAVARAARRSALHAAA